MKALTVALAGVALCVCGIHFACSATGSGNLDAVPDATPTTRRDSAVSSPADALPSEVDGGGDAGFLMDPAFWKEIPNPVGCAIYEAKEGVPFPSRTWASCGAGCRFSDGVLPLDKSGGVAAQACSGIYLNGEIYLSLQLGFLQTAMVQHVTRLSDGATIAAVAIRPPLERCTFGSGGDDAPLQFAPIAALDDGGVSWTFGRGNYARFTPVVWQANWVPNLGYATRAFMFDGAHGLAFQGGTLALLSSLDSSTWSLTSPLAGALMGTAARDSFVAAAHVTQDAGVISAAFADAATTELARLADAPVALAIDDQRIAWVGSAGSANVVVNGEYSATRLYWAPRIGNGIGAVVAGPTLSSGASAGYETLRLGGDYAATMACDLLSPSNQDPQCTLYVVRISTHRVSAIPHRPGANAFGRVLAVSPSEVVVGETDYPRHAPFNYLERVLRLDINSLDALGW